MAMTIIACGNEEFYTRKEVFPGWTAYRPTNDDMIAVVFREPDVVGTAQRMANKFPGQEIFVFHLAESFYTKPSNVVRKIYNPATGEMIPA